MKQLSVLSILLVLVCTSFASLPPGEVLPSQHFDISWEGEEWVEAHSKVSEMMEIKEFVRKGDRIKNWKELITEQSILAKVPEAMTVVEALNKGMNRKFRTFQTQVISESPTEVLYEWWQSDKKGYGPEHVISLVIRRSEYSVTTVSYARKGPKMTEENRELWINRLKNLKYK